MSATEEAVMAVEPTESLTSIDFTQAEILLFVAPASEFFPEKLD